VLVFRPVIDQEKELGCWQTLDQAIEQCLSLGIDPVQVFKEQHQRLHLAFPQENPFESVKGTLASLGWVKLQKQTVLRKRIQKE
jgi:hypothetical protein